jgi:uncharacterized SAM-binding protein YcdF (DUF218 family)
VKRRFPRWLVIGGGILSAGVLGLAFVVDRFGQVERARRAAVIVVLGARVLEGGVASSPLRARVEKAVDLYRQGFGETLLFSGGIGRHPPAEAVVARDLAVSLGVPESACIVEAESHSTAENARLTARVLAARGVGSVVLVTDPYHLLRARQYFYREGLLAYPSPALRTERNQYLSERLYWTLREAFALIARPDLWWVRAPAADAPGR